MRSGSARRLSCSERESRPPLSGYIREGITRRAAQGRPTSSNNALSNGCLVTANGLATVTPPHVNPSCRSSERSSRHPAAAAADRITASQQRAETNAMAECGPAASLGPVQPVRPADAAATLGSPLALRPAPEDRRHCCRSRSMPVRRPAPACCARAPCGGGAPARPPQAANRQR